jgi:hypothetical protein
MPAIGQCRRLLEEKDEKAISGQLLAMTYGRDTANR